MQTIRQVALHIVFHPWALGHHRIDFGQIMRPYLMYIDCHDDILSVYMMFFRIVINTIHKQMDFMWNMVIWIIMRDIAIQTVQFNWRTVI